MAKNNEIENPSVNLIASGTTIKGDINSSGDIRIDGTVIGSIESKGKVVVGSTGNIEGEVACINGDFSGRLKAKVTVKELLSLKSSAKLNGDIITTKLAIEPGATFTGTCNMTKESSDQKFSSQMPSEKQVLPQNETEKVR